jgi:hypothetical protein
LGTGGAPRLADFAPSLAPAVGRRSTGFAHLVSPRVNVAEAWNAQLLFGNVQGAFGRKASLSDLVAKRSEGRGGADSVPFAALLGASWGGALFDEIIPAMVRCAAALRSVVESEGASRFSLRSGFSAEETERPKMPPDAINAVFPSEYTSRTFLLFDVE